MIDLPAEFEDARGSIHVIAHEHNGSVAVITSAPHVERANHYHKEDYHYCYVIYGQIHYYERVVGDSAAPKLTVYDAGSIFYTPPMVEHCMYFTMPTAFVTLGGKTRKQEEYEADLVRISSLHREFINQAGDK